MSKLIPGIIFIALFTFSTFGQKAPASKPDPAKAVRAAFDRLADGIRQMDAGKVMASYEKSERLLIFNNNGTATIGWETVNENVRSLFPKFSNVTLEIPAPPRVEMLGPKAAVVTCKWIQTQENDGKPENASGRMTLIFKLIGKDWKITHRHTSPDRPDATRPLFPSERQDAPG